MKQKHAAKALSHRPVTAMVRREGRFTEHQIAYIDRIAAERRIGVMAAMREIVADHENATTTNEGSV